jgi:TonB-linked SusC/RagA family outer membrane protein
MRKNKKRIKQGILFIFFLAVSSLSLSAQQKTISGTITEASTGEPVIGASVIVKGTSTGTVSDIDGNFTVKVPENGKILVVSYIGFTTQELPINKTNFSIALTENTSTLDELVVVGYGTMKRKDLLGAVGSVTGSAIAAVPVASVSEALTGKLAGVQITTTEGSPDAEVRIRVRGGGSITGDNQPLYIVDGFPVSSISDIPSGDIESIDVLKDAFSTAVYGSRGANGVVVVTTKSGKAGKITVNYNAFTSWKKLAKKLNVLSPSDYAHWQYERALLADGNTDKYTKYFGSWQDIDLYDNIPYNDWQDQMFGRTGFTFSHNISVSGGSDKSNFLLSYSHINDEAIAQLSDFRRDNLNFKFGSQLHERVKLDVSARYSNTLINGSGMNELDRTSSNDYRLKNAIIYPPIPVSGLTDTGETDDTFYLYDPLTSTTDNDRRQTRINWNVNAGLTWEIIDHLKLRVEGGMDDYRDGRDRFYGLTTYYVKNVPSAESGNRDLPALIIDNRDRKTYRNTNTLNYNFKNWLPKDHTLTLLAGQEYSITKNHYLKSTLHGFPNDFGFKEAKNLTTIGDTFETDNYFDLDDKLFSFFGRANYDFQDTYLFSLTFRADGSSKFVRGNRWGYFPSVSGAWRISSEPFMESTKTWLDDLKLRANYGSTGNNKIPNGSTIPLYKPSASAWVSDTRYYMGAGKTMPNPELKWETMLTTSVGLDFTILKGKLNGILDFYKNNSKDLLVQFPTSGTGYDYQYRNIGETENKGMEFTLNWTILNKKDYGLNFSANIGFNKNKIVSLNGLTKAPAATEWSSTEVGDDYVVAAGMPIGQIYGYESAGRYEVDDFNLEEYARTGKWVLNPDVDDASPVIGNLRPGSLKLKNQNPENGVLVNSEDKKVIGNALPIHTGGFTLNGRVYGFDLTANFNWSYGNDIYNANKIEYTSTSKYHSRNMIDIMAEGKRWNNLLPDGKLCTDPDQLREMNTNTTMWSPYMKQFVLTDWAVEDGSFLRLNTLTLGYTLPVQWTKKAYINTCRFYVTGYNVFCWTNYSGFDPEVSVGMKNDYIKAVTPGLDYSAYPKSRQFVVGINLTF